MVFYCCFVYERDWNENLVYFLIGDWCLAEWSLWNKHWCNCCCVRWIFIVDEFYLSSSSLFGTRMNLIVVAIVYCRENVGLLGLTRVGSRRVVQISAGFMIFFSTLGM